MNLDQEILNYLQSGYRLGVNPLGELRYRFPHYEWKHVDCESLQGNPRTWEENDKYKMFFRFDLRLVIATRKKTES